MNDKSGPNPEGKRDSRGGRTSATRRRELRERFLAQGVALGSTFGVALGTSLGLVYDNLAGGMGLGLSIGVGVGISLGAILEARQAKATTPSFDVDRRARCCLRHPTAKDGTRGD